MNFLWFELRRSSWSASVNFFKQIKNFYREKYRIAEEQTPLLMLYDNMLNFAHECRAFR
jgi:hypothetical protein